MIGDMNVNIGSASDDKNSQRYLNLLAFHGLLPCHSYVTRPASGSCLDHVFLKSRNASSTIVLNSTITDHKCDDNKFCNQVYPYNEIGRAGALKIHRVIYG
ncbi:hypothetical protein JYU34_007274 [Plutella xylostella]|uniref:Uncharacterized protein n=1 Tax=Plutella xylostella TaxID=51655 RepID=A0ABQ7QQ30_PLUXY|nr:hypothetical protein JYU34_007274 [Plutella xylostella]